MKIIKSIALVMLISHTFFMHTFEQGEPSSSSSSSTSSMPKSAMKKNEKSKKNITFSKALSTTTSVPRDQTDLGFLNIIPNQQDPTAILIAFAQETLPEVQAMIETCTDDLIAIWNVFSTAPSDHQAAITAFDSIKLHKKSYTENSMLLSEYSKLLGKYIRAAKDYIEGDDKTVDDLKDLLDSAITIIHTNAKARYIESKKPLLDRRFNNITAETPLKKYSLAVHHAQDILDGFSSIIKRVDTELKQAIPKKYHTIDYALYTVHKGRIEKEMLIERVLPYAKEVKERNIDEKILNAILREPSL